MDIANLQALSPLQAIPQPSGAPYHAFVPRLWWCPEWRSSVAAGLGAGSLGWAARRHSLPEQGPGDDIGCHNALAFTEGPLRCSEPQRWGIQEGQPSACRTKLHLPWGPSQRRIFLVTSQMDLVRSFWIFPLADTSCASQGPHSVIFLLSASWVITHEASFYSCVLTQDGLTPELCLTENQNLWGPQLRPPIH